MKALEQISGWLWSTPMVLLVLGIGTVFTVWMRVPQIRRIPDMIRQLKGGGGSERGISSFESLAMARRVSGSSGSPSPTPSRRSSRRR